jgi:hypothetical protein
MPAGRSPRRMTAPWRAPLVGRSSMVPADHRCLKHGRRLVSGRADATRQRACGEADRRAKHTACAVPEPARRVCGRLSCWSESIWAGVSRWRPRTFPSPRRRPALRHDAFHAPAAAARGRDNVRSATRPQPTPVWKSAPVGASRLPCDSRARGDPHCPPPCRRSEDAGA